MAVAGAVLGGGYGALGRYYGLGVDHLVAAEVVLGDGRVVHCSTDQAPDLFWALRGAGGGNFGAVTSLVLRTRPVVPATAFECHWPMTSAVDVITYWLAHAPGAPDLINAELAIIASEDPAEEPLVALFGVAIEGAEAFLGAFPPDGRLHYLSELGGAEAACHHTYPGEGAVEDEVVVEGPPPGATPGLCMAKSEFFDGSIPSSAVEELVAHVTRDRRRGEIRDLELIPWGGAIGRIAPDATAFVHRAARLMLKSTVQVSYRADGPRRVAAYRWLVGSWEITHPWGSGGIYPNYPDPYLADWAHAYFGSHLHRLRRIKAIYDPQNLLRFPQAL